MCRLWARYCGPSWAGFGAGVTGGFGFGVGRSGSATFTGAGAGPFSVAGFSPPRGVAAGATDNEFGDAAFRGGTTWARGFGGVLSSGFGGFAAFVFAAFGAS